MMAGVEHDALVVQLRAELDQLQAENTDLRARLVEQAGADALMVEVCRQLCAESRPAQYAEGWRAGYEQRARDLEADWHEMASRVARGGVPFDQLEVRRWGPGGRARFADPRPGDYRGGPVAWAGDGS